MELNITQKQLNVVNDNEVDALGNKIKLKADSLSNLGNHVINVPIIGEQKVDVSDKTNISETDSSYTLLLNDFTNVIDSGSKPINVKPKMIDGMRSNYAKAVPIVSMVSETTEPSFIETPEIVNNMEIEAPSVTVSEEPVAPIVKEEHDVVVNSDISLSENDDIGKMFEQVNNARQKLLGIKDEATKAENEAIENEQKVQELGVQCNEAEKQLQMVETRKYELQKKVISELKKQLYTMSSEQQKYGDTIISANSRIEESQNKIIDFKSKLNDYNQKISAVNDDIARAEEKYQKLMGMNSSKTEEDAYNAEEEYTYRKAA